MRTLIAAGSTAVALALVLTGCGSGDQAGAGSSAVAGKSAAKAWADARHGLMTAGSGRYVSRVLASGLTKPVTQESGSFDLAPGSSTSERTFAGVDEKTSRARQYTVRIRQTAAGGNFLQLSDWGTWDGCWLPMTAADLERQTGVIVADAARLPSGLRVLLDARVGRGGTGDGPSAEAGAVEVLQFLGVSAAALSGATDDLAKVTVPVVLGIADDGRAAGVTASGVDVVHALARAGVPISAALGDYVGKAQAELALSDLGTAVTVAAPRRATLLPAHPRKKQTCAAHR